jgi:hypothetical protein
VQREQGMGDTHPMVTRNTNRVFFSFFSFSPPCFFSFFLFTDLCNVSKEWAIHIQWSHAVIAEFFCQGDLELHLDRQVFFFEVFFRFFFLGFLPSCVWCVDVCYVCCCTCSAVSKCDSSKVCM